MSSRKSQRTSLNVILFLLGKLDTALDTASALDSPTAAPMVRLVDGSFSFPRSSFRRLDWFVTQSSVNGHR